MGRLCHHEYNHVTWLRPWDNGRDAYLRSVQYETKTTFNLLLEQKITTLHAPKGSFWYPYRLWVDVYCIRGEVILDAVTTLSQQILWCRVLSLYPAAF